MATQTVTLEYAQNNFQKLIDSLVDGTYSEIDLTKDVMVSTLGQRTQSQSVVGKLFPFATFDAADSGLNTDRHTLPQLTVAARGGLYRLVKNVADANAETDVSAHSSYTKNGATAAVGQITVPVAASILDGETFTLNDGTNTPTVFEFDKNSSVTAGNVAVDISTATTAADVRDAMISAINGVVGGLLITASSGGAAIVTLTNDGTAPTGNTAITDTVANAGFIPVDLTGAGSITYIAHDGGVGGDSITVTVTNTGSLTVAVVGAAVTITINAGTTTIAQVIAAIAADAAVSAVISATYSGVNTAKVAAQTITNLAGGGSAAGKFDAYLFVRTAGEDPTVALISKSCATAIGL